MHIPSSEIGARKAVLRRDIRTRRAGLSADERHRAAAAVAMRLLDRLSPSPGQVVGGYAAFGDELDPAEALLGLAARGCTLALPRMIKDEVRLCFHHWQAGDVTHAGDFGIAEPSPGAPELMPDLLLVPMVAFDRTGGRLGYGKGYYDRTLARLRASRTITTIGLAFALQEVPDLPTEAFDMPLDAICTEREWITARVG
ncbi:5-formyltetrahydrofolate cyclo-ligase [Marinivivus vitaminiproducens]|uniref:5-formyltetrahydrofolate cyclo-ligase n=1 Tax=Marinivivus vitaminiproducens TaxID=3035935 RepID=UPI0027A243EF|nr:5-formyltetrahydrofolate cyclo-ligase [Geminicoccaceae bacterium SCSIO 64248]